MTDIVSYEKRGRRSASGNGFNKTLYVNAADEEIWRKAKKYLNFYEDKGLSEFVTEQLRQVVEKYESKNNGNNKV